MPAAGEQDPFFSLVPVLLCVSSTDGYFHRVNREFTRVLGWTEEEMLTIPYLDLVHPDDIAATAGAVEQQSGGVPARAFVNRYRCKDGSYRWLSWESNPVEREGLMYAVARDVTEELLAEAALHAARDEATQANEAKNVFLSRMSHELRTPLNVVLGFGQLLQMGNLSDEQSESVDYILRAGRHLLDLIDEVLDISRIESRRLALSMETVALAEVVDEIVRLMEPLARESEVVLSRGHGDPGVHVWADRQRLKQVMLNLVSNGIKYNRAGGRVTVSWAGHGRDPVTLLVTDTGHGIGPELMDRLFAPFDRLGAEASGIQGTGLGLALSKALSEAMGGQLTVDSSTAAGTTFALTLQSAAPPGQSDAPHVAPPALGRPAKGEAKLILYVEDNLANLAVVGRLLASRAGVELMPAMQGSMGLELAVQHRPDLIILDLHLPDMTGREVLAAVRANPLLSAVPVIIASADSTPGQADRLLAAGANAYLTKPLDLHELLSLIDRLLLEAEAPATWQPE